MTGEEYRGLVAELAAAGHRRDRESAAIEKSYVDGMAALTAEVGTAQVVLDRAQARLADADATVTNTDAEAAELWTELRGRLSRRARSRLGPLPEPDRLPATMDTPDSTMEGDSGNRFPDDPGPAAVRLDQAAAVLARAGRDGGSTPVPVGFLPLLPPLGAVTSVLVLLLIRVIFWAVGDGHVPLNVLGQVLVFLAPFAGIPVAARLTRRRYGGLPDIGAVGLTVLGGMMASCALVVLIR